MSIQYNHFSQGLEEVLKRVELAKSKSPITFVSIYGSPNSGKSHLVNVIKNRLAETPIDEIEVKLERKNGVAILSHKKIPNGGVVFFPFYNNKDNTIEDPCQYIKLIIPKNVCPEPKIEFSIFMYNPQNHVGWRPRGEYDFVIKNTIPKKKISSQREPELL